MAKRKIGFTVLLAGEAWYQDDKRNVAQLANTVVEVDVDLEEAVRDPRKFEEAAVIVGRAVLNHGVRYAARSLRQWRRRKRG